MINSLKSMTIVFALLLVCTFIAPASTANITYYGGSMSARPITDNNNGTVVLEITLMSWFKRNGSQGVWCNNTKAQQQASVSTPGTLRCVSGCTTGGFTSAPVASMVCQSFSAVNDWSVTQLIANYLVTKSSANYVVSFQNLTFSNVEQVVGSVASVLPSVTALLTMTQNLTNRSDTNLINTTPITTISPLIYIPSYSSYALSIPFYDADGDVVNCRFSKATPVNECCKGFRSALSNNIPSP
jgi:hypothetical protein